MNERTLSWVLHWGRRVQTRLAEIEYSDVGEEHQHNQRKCGEKSPGELRCSGTCNPIRVDILSMHNLGHGRRVCGSGENYLGNLLPHLFFRNTKTLSSIVGALSTMTVKKSGLGIFNPVTLAHENYLSSQWGGA